MSLDLKAKVMVASPTYTGDFAAEYVYSIMQSQMLCLGHGIVLDLKFIRNLSLIQCARNYLLYQFLQDPDYTHIMWIDSDLGWTPNAIHRMVERELHVIGGVYPLKDDKLGFPYVHGTGEYYTPNGEVIQVDRLPGGFLLMSRYAAETISKAPVYKMTLDGADHQVPHVFDLVITNGELVSEDYTLCDKLNQTFRIYAETDISFTHMGRRPWMGNLYHHLSTSGPHGKPPIWNGL